MVTKDSPLIHGTLSSHIRILPRSRRERAPPLIRGSAPSGCMSRCQGGLGTDCERGDQASERIPELQGGRGPGGARAGREREEPRAGHRLLAERPS